jgi:hypothetical protein
MENSNARKPIRASNQLYKQATIKGYKGSYADFCEEVNLRNTEVVSENTKIHFNDTGAAAAQSEFEQRTPLNADAGEVANEAHPGQYDIPTRMVALKPTKEDETILGMPRGLAIGLGVVTLIFVLGLIYYFYTKNKKAEGGVVEGAAPVAAATTTAE